MPVPRPSPAARWRRFVAPPVRPAVLGAVSSAVAVLGFTIPASPVTSTATTTSVTPVTTEVTTTTTTTAAATATTINPATTTSTTATATTINPAATSTTAPPSTTDPAATSTVATTTVAAGPRTLSLAFMGDALWHSPLWAQAQRNFAATHDGASGYDFDPMLAELRPLLEPADLAVCHLETPIAPESEEYTTAPMYGVPADVVTAIADAGFDRCSTASNHTYDRRSPGIDRTVDVLETAGLGQSGMARTAAEIEPRVFEVNGVAVTHLSYTFSFNGLVLPADEKWRSALIDPERIIADAHAARTLGAEVVIVSLHWGVEGTSAVSGWQREIAEQITAPGEIDLVVGHHAHVLQPIEQVNGVWVVYGLGNMISNLPTSSRWPAACEDGAVAAVTITIGVDGVVSVGRPSVEPTWVDRDGGWVVHPVRTMLADPTIGDGMRGRLERSLARTTAVVGEFIAL